MSEPKLPPEPLDSTFEDGRVNQDAELIRIGEGILPTERCLEAGCPVCGGPNASL